MKTTGLNRIDSQNNIGLNGGSVGANGYLVTATRQCYSLVETRASNSHRVTTFARDYSRWSLARVVRASRFRAERYRPTMELDYFHEI